MGHTSQQKQSTNHGPAECSYFFKINLALEKTNCLLAFPWHSGHFDLSNLRSCDCPDRCQRKNVVSKVILGAREPLYTEIQKYTKDTIEIHQRHVSSIQPSIKSLLASTLFLVVVIFTGSIVYGQDETDSSDKWEVRLMPYVFFLSLDTEGTINGLSGDVDLSFDDIVDNLDFGAMGRVEAWKGKWGLFFDGLFFNLGADQDFRGRRGLVDFSVDADVRLGWAYSGLMYRLFEKPFGKNNEQRLVLRLMADLDMFTSERGLIWMSTLLV